MSKELGIDENVDLNIDNNNDQQSFLESTLGKVINFSLDTGLRAILPDIIEDEIVDIKDTLINEGFSEAINKVVDSAINFGKSAIGIVTGDFENVSQAEKAIEKGGIIDGVSDVIDFTVDKVSDLGIIPDQITSIIKTGKDVILDNVSSNIKKEFKSQTKNIDNLNSYTNSWKEGFENQDFTQMEKYIKKIQNTLDKTMPIENLITEARRIENLHELIKNNDGNFNLSEEQQQLAKLLT
ncbi:MAG: hypothetical protein J6A89_02210 [Clostridia bacterium]|nr:hypothetical protein [Clostridia bacterium]